jgi:hypothetical protein
LPSELATIGGCVRELDERPRDRGLHLLDRDKEALEPLVLAGSQRIGFVLEDLGDALQSRPSLGVATVGASSYEPVRRTLASART